MLNLANITTTDISLFVIIPGAITLYFGRIVSETKVEESLFKEEGG